MKPKDIFKLAVRILGLVFVYHGLTGLPEAASAVFTALRFGDALTFILTPLMAAWPLVVAFWLLRGAPFIMHIAYPHTTETSVQEAGTDCGHKVDA
jgi:hypothetical protein